jgi:4-hydroxy-3-methylbut-2-enyl diphosphate reductase
LCEEVLPTYFINDANNIIDENTIIRHHFRTHEMETVSNFLPTTSPIKILITSGASCPDAVIENVIDKLLSLLPEAKTKGAVMNELN